jgi:hypothetical protein
VLPVPVLLDRLVQLEQLVYQVLVLQVLQALLVLVLLDRLVQLEQLVYQVLVLLELLEQ